MMDDIWPEFKAAIIMALILIAIIVCAVIIGGNRDNKLWNNGHCPTCGSEWEYEQAVGHYYSTSYMYVCNKCGKRIEISEIR